MTPASYSAARSILLIACSFIFAGCLPSGSKSAVKVTMGRVTDESSFVPQVIQTSRRVSSTLVGFCTATLIGPRHVITAAHCVTKSKIREEQKNGKILQIISGILDNVQPLPNATYAAEVVNADVAAIFKESPSSTSRSIKASKVYIARGYYEKYDRLGNVTPNRLVTDFDLAVLELSESISLPKYATLPSGPDVIAAGTPISIFGFGCDDENVIQSEAKTGKQQIGVSRVVSLQMEQSLFTLGGQRGIARQCQGDSGGPSFKDPLDQLLIVGVHSTKADNQSIAPEGHDVYLGSPHVWKFLTEVIPAGTLQGGNSDFSTPPAGGGSSNNQLGDGTPPIQNRDENQDNNQPQPNGDFILDTALARSNGQLMLYIYSTKQVNNLAILGGDGNWYPANISCSIQPGWSVIRALPVAEGWLQKSSVQVWGIYNGSEFNKIVPLTDKR